MWCNPPTVNKTPHHLENCGVGISERDCRDIPCSRSVSCRPPPPDQQVRTIEDAKQRSERRMNHLAIDRMVISARPKRNTNASRSCMASETAGARSRCLRALINLPSYHLVMPQFDELRRLSGDSSTLRIAQKGRRYFPHRRQVSTLRSFRSTVRIGGKTLRHILDGGCEVPGNGEGRLRFRYPEASRSPQSVAIGDLQPQPQALLFGPLSQSAGQFIALLSCAIASE